MSQLTFDDYAAAKAAKADGMARAEAHAKPGWSDYMLGLVLRTCRERAYFTADDVFALVEYGAPTTHDRRAFGPVMIRAAKLRYCRKADMLPVNSRRRTLHCSPIQVWESLLA